MSSHRFGLVMTGQLARTKAGPTNIDVRTTRDDGIWSLATALAGAVTPGDVAAALAEKGAAAAGASFSNMALFDIKTNQVRVVHSSVMDPAIAARWDQFDLSEPTPLSRAIVTGRPVLIESPQAIREQFPTLVADSSAASISATASMPLASASGAILGAVGFGWPAIRRFDPGQIRALDLIANLAAQALDRALLYQRDREQSSLRERADAQLLQNAFLPRTLPQTATLDVAAVYLPASDAAMGGDWYDVFPVDGGTCVVIGDVAGHGLEAAAAMGQLRNTVRAYAAEDPSPARILSRLNRMMCRLEPGVHASAIVAVWDEDRGTLLRSNAGHPPILRCRTGEFTYLPQPDGGRLLGVSPDWEYQEAYKVLRPGTTLLFYTDGLIEQRGHDIDECMKALLAFVEGLDDRSPQATCDQVLQWRLRDGHLNDDVCVLAVGLR
jgi:serine phosphatase RsbU (regulator of sigma subunit)